jgi:hypothetical protein
VEKKRNERQARKDFISPLNAYSRVTVGGVLFRGRAILL